MEVKIFRIINQEAGILNITENDIEEIASLNPESATHTGEVTGDIELTITEEAVTTDKIANNAVTSDKLAADSVDNVNITDDAVRTNHIAPSQVTNPKLGQMPSNTLKGNDDISTGTPKDLTVAEVKAMLDIGSSSGEGNTINLITLADPTNLAELNAITGMSEGDLTVVTNYLNDKVTFIYDNVNWIRAKSQEFHAVVKYNETTALYEFVDDSDYTPLGILGITTRPGVDYQFSIQYPTSSTIGSVVAGLDEEYSKHGYFIGTNVGKSETLFRITKQGFNVNIGLDNGDLKVIEDTNTLVKTDDVTVIHDDITGETTIGHSSINCNIDNSAFVSDRKNVLRPYIKSHTSTSAIITWWKWSDNGQQFVISNDMKINYGNHGIYVVPGKTMTDAGKISIKGTLYTA